MSEVLCLNSWFGDYIQGLLPLLVWFLKGSHWQLGFQVSWFQDYLPKGISAACGNSVLVGDCFHK